MSTYLFFNFLLPIQVISSCKRGFQTIVFAELLYLYKDLVDVDGLTISRGNIKRLKRVCSFKTLVFAMDE